MIYSTDAVTELLGAGRGGGGAGGLIGIGDLIKIAALIGKVGLIGRTKLNQIITVMITDWTYMIYITGNRINYFGTLNKAKRFLFRGLY